MIYRIGLRLLLAAIILYGIDNCKRDDIYFVSRYT